MRGACARPRRARPAAVGGVGSLGGLVESVAQLAIGREEAPGDFDVWEAGDLEGLSKSLTALTRL